MHVAVVTTSFPEHPGDPSGHFVRAEVLALVRQGHRVTVLAPRSRERRDEHEGYRVVQLPHAGLFGWPGAPARLMAQHWRAVGLLPFVTAGRAAIARLRADSVIAHWLVPCGVPVATAARADIEVVAHGSDVRLLERLPKPLRDRLLSALVEREARFRFVSLELLERLASATSAPIWKRSRVEPAAIDVLDTPDRTGARRRLGLDPQARIIVIASRLVPGKRVRTALCAASLVGRARLVVLGDGPELERLRSEFPRVEFVGRVPRPAALCWISAADLVLSASRTEGAPSVIREARALGVPVVSAPCGDLTRLAAFDPDLFVCR